MNRKREKDSYDREAVGRRIQQKRILLEMSQEELAERIDRASKYCSEIERGISGMSVETMIAFSKALDMSLDYMIFGSSFDIKKDMESSPILEILHVLSTCSEDEQSGALRLLTLFLSVTRSVRKA